MRIDNRLLDQRRSNWRWLVRLLTIWWLACHGFPSVHAAPPVYWNSFEGPFPSWKLHSSDAHPRFRRHERVQDIVRSGNWSEAVTIAAHTGSQVYLAHKLDQAVVIDELSMGLWLRADRPGLQLAARVVLPRTEHPRTGQPLSVLIYGDLYRDVGTWQQLRIDNVPRLVSDQVRILRSGFKGSVDPKEAYVDRLLVNGYGGAGVTNLWIDDVEVIGFVPRRPTESAVQQASFEQDIRLENSQAVMRGSILYSGGKPLLPRLIQYRQEPFALLSDLGFNAVKLDRPLGDEQQMQAAQSGLWIIQPRHIDPPAHIAPRILAWNLASGRDVRATIDQIRHWRTTDHRLIVSDHDENIRSLRRHLDAVIVRPPPNRTGFHLRDYASWMQQVQQLSAPRNAMWAGIVTDLAHNDLPHDNLPHNTVENLPHNTVEQPGAASFIPPAIPHSAVRHQIFLAIAAGARGFYFLSHRPLHGTDDMALQRRQMLELVQHELDIIEPWIVGRSFVETVESTGAEMRAAVLQSERGRLVLPLPTDHAGEMSEAHPNQTIHLLVPGVPASNRAYVLKREGMRPVPLSRVTGGGQITLDVADRNNIFLITEDPRVVNHVSQHLQQLRRRVASRTVKKSPASSASRSANRPGDFQ